MSGEPFAVAFVNWSKHGKTGTKALRRARREMVEDERVLDEVLLREIAHRVGSLTVVDTVRVFPPQKPASVVAQFADVYYPNSIQHVKLELRAYQNGDFNVTYREVSANGEWMCRWDRHENPHNTRDHYHQPPRARTGDAVDSSFPVDFFDVIEVIVDEIDTRLGELWEDTA